VENGDSPHFLSRRDSGSGRASDPSPPAVRARLEAIHQAEAKLDIDALIKLGVEGVAVREFRFQGEIGR
jgi:hypothetical protein